MGTGVRDLSCEMPVRGAGEARTGSRLKCISDPRDESRREGRKEALQV